MRPHRLLTACILAAAPIAPPVADAQTPVPSQIIIEQLRPERTGPLARSWMTSSTRGIEISGQLPVTLDLPRIALTINFELDSDRLTMEGMLSLRSLAKALIDPALEGMRFQIAGHTDGRGGPAYNQGLSERRARRVVEHLINYYSVPAAQLIPVGYGMSQPLDATNPLNPMNRRVEIVNVTPDT